MGLTQISSALEPERHADQGMHENGTDHHMKGVELHHISARIGTGHQKCGGVCFQKISEE